MDITIEVSLDVVHTLHRVNILFHNIKPKHLTWHALAVMSDGVSGENAGLRAAPTYINI